MSKVVRSIATNYKPDIIVAATNGGLIPSGVVATGLNIKDVRCLNIGRRGESRHFIYPKDGDIGDIKDCKILIIEDDVYTGNSVFFAKKNLLKRGAKEVRIACVFKNANIKSGIDFYAKEVTKYPLYPWKIPHFGDR